VEALTRFALDPDLDPEPGEIHDVTPERHMILLPSWRIPGPNGVHRIRCRPERVDAMIDETRALAEVHSLPLMWMLDDTAAPADLPERFAKRGILPDERSPETIALVLGGDAEFGAPPPSIVFQDALGSLGLYATSRRVADLAFNGKPDPEDCGDDELYRRRFEEAREIRSAWRVLAFHEGIPAACGSLRVRGSVGLLNGGAVVPALRGRGIYRALVAERYRLALAARAVGVVTHAGPMSLPILRHLGFEPVGRHRHYKDQVQSGG